ncbi:MAG: PhnD/SsuA/transferrin family substrate-binding protein [Elusimicrobiota bacterium]
MLRRTLFACLLSLTVLAGCGRRDEATVGSDGNPLVVILSPLYMPGTRGDLDFVQRHLTETSGMAVQVRVATSAIQVVEAFGAGTADAGLINVDEYLLAREEYGVSPTLQALRHEKETEYTGVLLVRPGTISSVRALAGKKVAFAKPTSLSGFLLPAVFLLGGNIDIQAEFTGSHEESIRRLKAGEVAAAATYFDMISRHRGLRILAKTGMVPNEPFVLRHGLRRDKRQAITAAFQSLGDTAEGKAVLRTMADISGFRPVWEDTYAPIHEILRAANKSVYDLVPEGWEMRRLNRPYLPD